MRMSLPRVVLRVILLVTGGVFLLWRAAEARRVAPGLGGGQALLLGRIALVEGLVGILALLTAAALALSLRRRRREKPLSLGGGDRPARGPRAQ